MRALLNSIAGRAQQAGASFTGTREGIITSYDPTEYAIKVTLQPDGAETGWIPLDSPWVGNGWGMAAGPMIGASIKIDFDSGNISNGSGGGQHYNDVDRCPGPPSGEFWVVHESGSMVKFLNDGQVFISANTKAVYTAQLHHFIGPVMMDDTLTVTKLTAMNGGFTAQNTEGGNAGVITGDMTATGTVTGQTDVVASGVSGKSHTHRENGAGSDTDAPN